MTLQEWRAESEKLLERHAGDKLPEFVQGSFWAAFQIAQPMWKDSQELRAKYLCDFKNAADSYPFYWQERQLITDHDGRFFAAMVPSSRSSNFWTFSFDGFAYCRQTFTEDALAGNSEALNRQSPITFTHTLIQRVARMLTDMGRLTLQIGIVGIQGRQLDAPESNAFRLGIAKVNKAESDPIEIGRKEMEGQETSVAIIEKLTQPLYAAFGYSGLTSSMIRDFLVPNRT